MEFINITIGSPSPAPQTWLSTVVPGLAVALIAGVTLFLLNWGREWLTAHLKRKSEAEVLAFGLVTLFDKLISECADVVNDPLYEDQQTGYWRSTVKHPEFFFPENVTWSVFPKALQYRVRSIPNQIDVANRNIDSIAEYGDGPPDYSDAFEESKLRFGMIGLEACLINRILATEYDVPVLDRGDWDPEEKFRDEIKKIIDRREEEKAANVWVVPDWMLPKVPIEELNSRHSKLTQDLEAAQSRLVKA